MTSFPWAFEMEPWCSGNPLASCLWDPLEFFSQMVQVMPNGVIQKLTSLLELPETPGLLEAPGLPLRDPSSRAAVSSLQLRAKSGSPPIFVDEVLLEHGHTDSFVYCLGLLSCWRSFNRDCMTKPKIFIVWLLTEQFCDPCSSMFPSYAPHLQIRK